MTAPPNLLTVWARLLAASLEQAGIATAVISPGSRSTPFAHAFLRTDGIRCVSIVDERAAGFYAIGHARMTGRPVALLCTSGSAAANYFPAVVEAARAAVPLLVLTADRPFELQAADAPQTIDQVQLFGAHARAFFDPGMPDAEPQALRALRRIAAQAVHATRVPLPGPVHVNLRARKPLEPRTPDDDAAAELQRLAVALAAEGVTGAPLATATAAADALRDLARRCRATRRGLIVCGPASPAEAAPERVLELARRTGFAVATEATSQLRFRAAPDVTRLDALDAILAAGALTGPGAPALVIEVGATPTSSAWRDHLQRADAPPRAVFTPRAWSDPHGTARNMVPGPLAATLGALIDALDALDDRESAARDGPDEAWHQALRSARREGWDAVEAVLAGEPGFPEAAAVRGVVRALPDGAILALGNSLPVREVDAYCPAGDRRVDVWSQRGANGIDGLIAGAAGAAAAADRPTTLLLGDVSFLHDVGGLAVARDATVPLALVVLDNGGGRIFEQLPLAGADAVTADELEYWLTPPRIDLRQAAGAFGVGYARAEDADALAAALRQALSRPGATVVHAVVDGARTTAVDRAVRAATAPRPAPGA